MNNNILDQKILITGNGFDLAHGLPTAYTDFIKIIKLLDEAAINELKEYINQKETKCNYELTNVDYKQMLSSYNDLKKHFDYDIVNYFRQVEDINGWVDFETEIQKLVYTLSNMNNWYDMGALFYNEEAMHYDIYEDYDEITYEEKLNESTILSHMSNLKFLFPSGRFDKKYYLHKNVVNTKLVLMDLYLGLGELEKLFTWYIDNVVNKILDNHKKVKDNDLLQKMDYHVTFNYTNTIDKLYSNKSINRKSYHIHGSVNDDNILFGYNYEHNQISKQTRPFTKLFKRIHYETSYTAIKDIKKILIDKSENFVQFDIVELEVHFWGHSLDVTDSDTIQQIFSFINIPLIKTKFIVYYHNLDSKFSMINNLFEILGQDVIEEYTSIGLLQFEEKNENLFE